jgi:hypothetical protein
MLCHFLTPDLIKERWLTNIILTQINRSKRNYANDSVSSLPNYINYAATGTNCVIPSIFAII